MTYKKYSHHVNFLLKTFLQKSINNLIVECHTVWIYISESASCSNKQFQRQSTFNCKKQIVQSRRKQMTVEVKIHLVEFLSTLWRIDMSWHPRNASARCPPGVGKNIVHTNQKMDSTKRDALNNVFQYSIHPHLSVAHVFQGLSLTINFKIKTWVMYHWICIQESFKWYNFFL
jgi:hypothetical protein